MMLLFITHVCDYIKILLAELYHLGEPGQRFNCVSERNFQPKTIVIMEELCCGFPSQFYEWPYNLCFSADTKCCFNVCWSYKGGCHEKGCHLIILWGHFSLLEAFHGKEKYFKLEGFVDISLPQSIKNLDRLCGIIRLSFSNRIYGTIKRNEHKQTSEEIRWESKI